MEQLVLGMFNSFELKMVCILTREQCQITTGQHGPDYELCRPDIWSELDMHRPQRAYDQPVHPLPRFPLCRYILNGVQIKLM